LSSWLHNKKKYSRISRKSITYLIPSWKIILDSCTFAYSVSHSTDISRIESKQHALRRRLWDVIHDRH